jgi:hypothetical protein
LCSTTSDSTGTNCDRETRSWSNRCAQYLDNFATAATAAAHVSAAASAAGTTATHGQHVDCSHAGWDSPTS